MLWWAWSAYAWLTNTVDPEERSVRMAMFAAIGAAFGVVGGVALYLLAHRAAIRARRGALAADE